MNFHRWNRLSVFSLITFLKLNVREKRFHGERNRSQWCFPCSNQKTVVFLQRIWDTNAEHRVLTKTQDISAQSHQAHQCHHHYCLSHIVTLIIDATKIDYLPISSKQKPITRLVETNFSSLLFGLYWINYYFCNRSHTYAEAKGWKLRDGNLYIEKALLDALCLTFWNLAVP